MFISHNLAKNILFKFSPETAHAVTLNALEMLANLHLSSLFFGKPPIGKSIKIMGLDFKNPIGLAAGLDKNADCIDGLGALGFGFVEVEQLPHVRKMEILNRVYFVCLKQMQSSTEWVLIIKA